MKKGFFISVDLIITIASVILLLGVLGVYMHNSINDFVEYKEQVRMDATMNIVLNRLALSENSCDLVSESGTVIKQIGFCLDSQKLIANQDGFYEDLNYNVTLVGKGMLQVSGFNSGTKYIMKEVNILVSNGPVKKSKYYSCLAGVCDLNSLVKIYVWK